jgi:hypothetical protein
VRRVIERVKPTAAIYYWTVSRDAYAGQQALQIRDSRAMPMHLNLLKTYTRLGYQLSFRPEKEKAKHDSHATIIR